MRLFYAALIFISGWMLGALSSPSQGPQENLAAGLSAESSPLQGPQENPAAGLSAEKERKPELDYVDSFCGEIHYKHIWTASNGTEVFEVEEVLKKKSSTNKDILIKNIPQSQLPY